MVNRLQCLMDGLISPFRNAFIMGRLIFYNIFLTTELMTFIHHVSKGKSSWGALEIDMAKAYDRVSWNFLAVVLRWMNFPTRLVDYITQCVTTTSFSLLLNRKISSNINVNKGLKQGDPLSPYLFIICMNVFSCLMMDAKKINRCQGIQFVRRGPSISHLMYADDPLDFWRPYLILFVRRQVFLLMF